MSSYFRKPAEFYRRSRWSYPDTLRLTGSVIPSILWDVVVITSFSTGVFYAHEYLKEQNPKSGGLNVPGVIVPALSVVVGLILAFRTNTAYDRFWEGRKLWSSLDVQVRNFARLVWLNMKDTPHNVPESTSSSSTSISTKHLFGRSSSTANKNAISNATLADYPPHADDHEKILVLNFVLAYVVAVKHHLRQEFGTKYHDLEFLLPQGFAPCAATDQVEIKVVQDKAVGDKYRAYSKEPWVVRSGNENGQLSLPIEITFALSAWVTGEARAGRIDSFAIGNLMGNLASMTDIFTNMERIVFTPIPLAYSIHLRQVVYLYCLALPFTFLDNLGFLLIPLMALVSFTLFGMEGIGREIENPFGSDSNDLHMDEFCRDLKHEIEYIVNMKTDAPGSHH